MIKKNFNILIYVLGFIIFIFPFLPYRLPDIFASHKKIYLDISNTQSTGGYNVISGNNHISEYANNINKTDIKLDEINITGDIPYNKIKIINGIYDFKKFRIYGSFTNSTDKNNVLTFNIEKWYPLNKYVALHDIYFWDNIKIIYYNILFCYLIITTIIIVISLLKISY